MESTRRDEDGRDGEMGKSMGLQKKGAENLNARAANGSGLAYRLAFWAELA